MVVDVQNDFIPVADAPSGGRFGVADGAAAAEVCVTLIQHFHHQGCLVVASKDYHPRCAGPAGVKLCISYNLKKEGSLAFARCDVWHFDGCWLEEQRITQLGCLPLACDCVVA